MASTSSFRLSTSILLAALAAFALWLAVPTSGEARKASASQKASGKIALGTSKSLGAAPRCRPGSADRRARTSSKRRGRAKTSAKRNCAPKAPAAAPVSLYWGATIGDQLTGGQAPWDMNAVAAFEAMAGGKTMSLVHLLSPFSDCSKSPCSFYDFPTKPMETIRQHGSIPVLSWASESTPAVVNEPDYQLADVIAGNYDTYIREFATEAKEWGHPFFLRFNWEMNGTWFAWSEGVNGNQKGEYVAAWRHVHDIFESVGATNVSWVWCPNIDPTEKFQDLAELYPGDEYVDWTGLDGYNWGTNPARPDRWRTFEQLYRSTYERIVGTIAPSKPMMIGEIGSTEYGGSKAEWLSEMLTQLPVAYPQIRALLYFERFDDGMDWPIETSASAASAFATAMQSPSYLPGQYADLPDGPISPPS